jgi:hypothetical protein
MNFSMAKKGKKKRGPVTSFEGDEEEEAKQASLAVRIDTKIVV